MTIFTFLSLLFSLGTTLGAGGATFAQIFFLKAVQDREMNDTERGFLRITFRVIRIGMLMIIFSGAGLSYLWYESWRATALSSEALFSAVPASFWFLTILIAFVFCNRLLIEKMKAPMWLATGWLLASWYGFFIVSSYPVVVTLSLVQLLSWYGLGIIFSCFALWAIRKKYGIVLNR